MGWLSLAVLLLPLLAAAGLVLAGRFGIGFYDELLDVHFTFVLPFLPALLLANALSEELEMQTHTFLFARPTPRSALLIGKATAVLIPMALALIALLPLEYLVSLIRFPNDLGENFGHLFRSIAAAVLGTFGYGALALGIGARFWRHPFMSVLGYLVIVESGLGNAPVPLHLVTLHFHLHNIAGLPLPPSYFLDVAVAPWQSAIAAVAITALFGILAARTIDKLDTI